MVTAVWRRRNATERRRRGRKEGRKEEEEEEEEVWIRGACERGGGGVLVRTGGPEAG